MLGATEKFQYWAMGAAFFACSMPGAAQEVEHSGVTPQQSVPEPEQPPQPEVGLGGGERLQQIEIISTSPVLGSGVNADKLPNSIRVLKSSDLEANGGPASLTNALAEQVGSVNLNSTFGNPYQPDLTYRGFVASPVVGVPQGFAVYQSGVRINEAFGDTVNWDLIPDFAIDSMNLTSTNPVFGFNALGGAAAIEMKDGFRFHGLEAELRYGSFGRETAVAQYGERWGELAAYVAFSPSRENGWRQFSPSRTDKTYGDLGFDNGTSTVHVSFTYANDSLNGMGPSPLAYLERYWAQGVDYPGNTQNIVYFGNVRGSTEISDTISIQGNVYYRNFDQSYRNGTMLLAQPCSTGNTAVFCTQDANGSYTVPIVNQYGQDVATGVLNGVGLGPSWPGYDALSSTRTASLGSTLQLTSTRPVAGHENHFVSGISIDSSRAHFNSGSQFGAWDQNRTLILTPSPLYVNSGGNLTNVSLYARNNHQGVYVTDTFDITSALSATASARYNRAWLGLEDELGGDLSGSHRYTRLNPAFGATYKVLPVVTAFADYAESNRIPSVAELSCASPAQSCSLASFFVADPNLNQVVARTYEVGVRGGQGIGHSGRLQWDIGAFRTDISNDILEEASGAVGRGFFQNDGNTRRQGVEAGANYRSHRWNVFADYSYIQATFQSYLTVNSPFNPFADALGHIHVRPGDTMPSVPRQRLKLGMDVWATQEWAVGGTCSLVSRQVLVGDEANQNPEGQGYATVGMHTEYRIGESFELFGNVDNLLDRHYYASGTFSNIIGLPPGNIGNTVFFTPAAPRLFWVGARGHF